MTSSVLFHTVNTAGTQKIGIATLNRPETLNGLSLDMCERLRAQLILWQDDATIALVVLNGAGERAFCAGGDLHRLYESLVRNSSGDPWANEYARTFFDVEYRLDYLIHTFQKPVLCWGNGVVMGGGVGLMMGASHRVVTNTTRFAMPEVSIGLFPDVAGTWMLSRLPAGTGRFLAMTGAQLGASDCRFLGLADYCLDANSWPMLLTKLAAQQWSDTRSDNEVKLNAILGVMQADSPPCGPLQRQFMSIRELCSGPDFDAICARLSELDASSDPWLARAGKNFKAGSPGSARLGFALLNRVHHFSLADVFRLEYTVSLQCSVQGDLQEGIRALLIDKDKRPRWTPSSFDLATEEWVQRFFVPAWPSTVVHPLADLGTADSYRMSLAARDTCG